MKQLSRNFLIINLIFYSHFTQAQSFYDGAEETTTPGIYTVNNFGPYVDQLSIGWIFEFDLGWMFSFDVGDGSAWFFSQDLDSWIWTTPDFFPAFYHEASGAWWYLGKGTNPRLFYNFSTEQFVDISGNPFSNNGMDFVLRLEQYHVPEESDITYEGPTISDNGKQLIFRGTIADEPVIFVSSLESGAWTVPEVAFSTNTAIQNSDAQIISFSQKKTSGPSENFNGPMIADNVATFGAEIDTGESGVFYAEKIDGNWQTKLILKTSDSTDGKTVSSVDAPYVSDNKILFLATLSDTDSQSSSAVFSFDLSSEALEIIVDSAEGDIDQYWDMSVNKGRFSVRAEHSVSNDQNMYIHQTNDDTLLAVYSGFILPPGTNNLTVGGPSYFFENGESYVANLIFFKQDDTVENYQIYTNILPTYTWLETGDVIANSNNSFQALANPTLSINENKAWMFFQATISGSSQTGAYLSHIKLDEPSPENTAYAIVQPGDEFDDGPDIVNQVLLGPVSLRSNRIAMTLQSDTGKYALLVYQLQAR